MTSIQQTVAAFFGSPEGPSPLVLRKFGRAHLCKLFAHLRYLRGAEVGVWEGRFSQQICEANPGVNLTCVDPWQWYADYIDPKNDAPRIEAAYLSAKERLAPYQVTFTRMTSIDGATTIADGSLDFVYLDGNHGAKYVQQDLDAWAPKVRSGGIISGHDYSDKGKHIEVKPVVNRYVAEHGIDRWYVLGADKSASFCWVQA